MPLDPAKVADVRAWLHRAAEDLRAAAHERTATPPLSADMAFHAQQATEKTLKGLLAWYDRPFRKTHDLVELGEACAALAPELEPLLRKAAPLTEYAWRFRYPGAPEDPPIEEADSALALARAVFDAIRSRLPPDVAA